MFELLVNSGLLLNWDLHLIRMALLSIPSILVFILDYLGCCWHGKPMCRGDWARRDSISDEERMS